MSTVAVDGVRTVRCHLQDSTAIRQAVTQGFGEGAAVDVLLHNAVRLHVAPFAELRCAEVEDVWRASVASALAAVQAVLPGMLAKARGAVLFSGATASRRGSAGYAAFASAKFALRGLAQSLAREVQPQGVHVVHVVLDGLPRGSPPALRLCGTAEQSPSSLLDPTDVAGPTGHWPSSLRRHGRMRSICVPAPSASDYPHGRAGAKPAPHRIKRSGKATFARKARTGDLHGRDACSCRPHVACLRARRQTALDAFLPPSRVSSAGCWSASVARWRWRRQSCATGRAAVSRATRMRWVRSSWFSRASS